MPILVNDAFADMSDAHRQLDGEASQAPLAVSVVLPVMDETDSLRQTVEVLLAENSNDISEILIVVCGKTTQPSMAVAEGLRARWPDMIRVRSQQRPFLGGAMRDAFEWSSGSHVLMMASDLETEPRSAKDLIAAARRNIDIVTATRWSSQDGFQGYDPLKYTLNWIFQILLRVLYGSKLSDFTFGFRIFRARWVKDVQWTELRHPFLLETILKPLRLGAQVMEIPTTWKARVEGESHNPFSQNFVYLRTALKIRFTPKEKMLRNKGLSY
ncbi:MAG: glycosyltransferase family 2 protein [Acidobacteriaceae bacterium]|nr:glycosyltransferase family 2 protein [Acidobacteriaceae bacterium]